MKDDCSDEYNLLRKGEKEIIVRYLTKDPKLSAAQEQMKIVNLKNKLKNHKYWKKEVIPKRNNLFQYFIQYLVLSLIDGSLVESIPLCR